MSRALLYCPMNPPAPGAPPSGDRAMSGLLTRALGQLGYTIDGASALRSYEATGNTLQQSAIAAAAETEVTRLIAAHRAAPPALWLTYMNYYKSPDHLGPAVAAALNIPYAIVEASYAAKRAAGDFAAPHAAAKRALQAANAVIAMTAHDRIGLAAVVPPERLFRLDPFIDTALFPPARSRPARTPIILSVAMLRPGKKLANFPLIAAALARIADLPWHYLVAGDGSGHAEAEAAFANFPPTRVTFAGRFPPESMAALYARADLYLWPGLKEAFGLAFLEAQASGLPVVACDTAGVPAVVHQGRGGFLSTAGDSAALAQSLRILLANRQTRETMGEVASAFVHGERSIVYAAQRLAPILKGIGA
ncbi:D-inositol-3-phosphate glycosyltransferase [Alphaproteobacteria bacterium SO-S41]|nr:D-inositol-3-phosphate glycosyltransferase [Alphaproteobacteria bacterium SO-S41]